MFLISLKFNLTFLKNQDDAVDIIFYLSRLTYLTLSLEPNHVSLHCCYEFLYICFWLVFINQMKRFGNFMFYIR